MAASNHVRGARGKMRARRWVLAAGLAAGIAAAALVVTHINSAPAVGTAATYAVGSPGPGSPAPAFSLPATTGRTISLRDYRGKTVLLYFHEGLGCQPCWDQIRDLDAASAQLKAAGVDQLLTITSGPVNLIAQKMADDHLTATALADTNLRVSTRYHANRYGMMGDSRDGHSFILVGPHGHIRWRADYGGAPNYTMYVPVAQLLADMKAGTKQ